MITPLRTLVLMMAVLTLPTQAAIVYSGNQDIQIDADFEGLYIDFDNHLDPTVFDTNEGVGTTGTLNPNTDAWDFNLFFGGAALGNSDTFAPVLASTTTNSAVLNLTNGDMVGPTNDYPSGFSGSLGHMGTGTNQFPSGSTGFVGFSIPASSFSSGATGTHYGWASVTLNNDGAPGTLNWWAWDDQPNTAVTIVPEVSALGVSSVCLLSGLILHRRRCRTAA